MVRVKNLATSSQASFARQMVLAVFCRYYVEQSEYCRLYEDIRLPLYLESLGYFGVKEIVMQHVDLLANMSIYLAHQAWSGPLLGISDVP
jgi:hypothetical protein